MIKRDTLTDEERDALAEQEVKVDIKKLQAEKVELINAVSDLKTKLLKADEEAKKIIDAAELKATKIKDDATALFNKVKSQESVVADTMAQANAELKKAEQKSKELDALLKSNKGREENLKIEAEDSKALKIKLLNTVKHIQDTLK